MFHYIPCDLPHKSHLQYIYVYTYIIQMCEGVYMCIHEYERIFMYIGVHIIIIIVIFYFFQVQLIGSIPPQITL